MKAIDVAKDLALSGSEGNPLKIDGELSRDGLPTSGAVPFAGENINLFLRLLERSVVRRGEEHNPVRGGT